MPVHYWHVRSRTPPSRFAHHLSLTFATDFDEAFKPTDPIVRIGCDALRVEVVLSEFFGGAARKLRE
jgi:hypothetical protein